MKIIKKTLFLFLVITGFIACEKEEKESYYSTLGVIKVSNDSIIIDSDSGEKLFIHNDIPSYFKNGHRILAWFTITDEEVSTGIDFIIDVIDIDTVLFKPIIDLTSENSDSLGSDPAEIENLWVAKDFMNINFKYYGGNTSHIINLAMANDTTPNDTITLELRHNENGDNGILQLVGFVSFDLTKAKVPAADSVILKITGIDLYSDPYEHYITYRY